MKYNRANLADIFVGGEVEASDVHVHRIVQDITRQLLLDEFF